jgi:hypothetical protein
MRYVFLALGIVTGLAFARIPHYLDQWSTHGLPVVEWNGPKYRHWHNGTEDLTR